MNSKHNLLTHPLILIVAGAFAIRIIALLIWRHYAPMGDSIHLLLLAQSFAHYGGDTTLTHHFPPLYSFLIGTFYFLSPSFFFAGRLISLLSSSLLIIPYHYLCRPLLGYRLLILSSALFAFSPLLVNLSLQIWSESLYFLLLFCGLLFSYQFYVKASLKSILLAAGFFAASYYTRDEAFLPFLLTLFLLLFLRRRQFLHLFLFFILYAILLIPRLMEIYSYYGVFLLTGKEITNAIRASVFAQYFPNYINDSAVYQQATSQWLQTVRSVDASGNLALFSLANKYSMLKFFVTHPENVFKNFIAHWKDGIFSLPPTGYLLLLLSLTGVLNLFLFKKKNVVPLIFLFIATTPIFAITPLMQINQFSIPYHRLFASFIPLASALSALNLRYLLLLRHRRLILHLVSHLTLFISAFLIIWSLLLSQRYDKITRPYQLYYFNIQNEAQNFLPYLPSSALLSSPHEYFLLNLPFPSVIYPLDKPEKNHIYFNRHKVTNIILSTAEWQRFKTNSPDYLLSQYYAVKQSASFVLVKLVQRVDKKQ